MIIDAHQHYWDPARGDYGWMPADDPVLTRVYGPSDLAKGREITGVTKTVLVQAAPTVAETDYLLSIAADTPTVAAVVGWINFEDPSERQSLDRLAQNPYFVGVRPMIQDLDDGWMHSTNIQWAYAAAAEMDLTFDALGFPRHLKDFDTLFSRYPSLRTVVDHCMKPQIDAFDQTAFQNWADGISRLAAHPHVFCKLSGIVTEADDGVTVDRLQPYTDHVIAAFGANRVMWGSDWPVLRLRYEYETWFRMAQELTQSLDTTSRSQIFGGTATQFYRL